MPGESENQFSLTSAALSKLTGERSNFPPITDKKAAAQRRIRSIGIGVILALVLVASAIIRIRTSATPLERDEGEYAYAGQLMLQGVPPYVLAYNMKMPGIYAAYALILAIFGQTQVGIHIAVMILNLVTVLLLLAITKRMFGGVAGLAAAAFFAIASMSNMVGASANAENFVLLFALGGILLLMQYTERQKLWRLMAGAFLIGVGFMMKQPGAAFMLFGFLYVSWQTALERPVNYKKLISVSAIFSFFALLPFLLTCLSLWRCGVFGKFWFWTVEYASQYVSSVPLDKGAGYFEDATGRILPGVGVFALLALLGLWGLTWSKAIRKHGAFMVGFFLFSFIAVCPGLYFRGHYFMLVLPAAGVLAGAGITAGEELLRGVVKSDMQAFALLLLIVAGAWVQTFYSCRHFFTATDPSFLVRCLYDENPFYETLKIAEFLKSVSNQHDKVAVFGSEPEILFYSQRRSATSYIYTYPMMEKQPYALQMQQEMIRQIETEKPKFAVLIHSVMSWLPRPYSNRMIFQWADHYFATHYRQIGLVETFPAQNSVYHWDATSQLPGGNGWLLIMERVHSSPAHK